MFLYTDGLTETNNEKGEEYGPDRLRSFVESRIDKDLKQIHEELMTELDEFKGKNSYHDDITILSCKMASE